MSVPVSASTLLSSNIYTYTYMYAYIFFLTIYPHLYSYRIYVHIHTYNTSSMCMCLYIYIIVNIYIIVCIVVYRYINSICTYTYDLWDLVFIDRLCYNTNTLQGTLQSHLRCTSRSCRHHGQAPPQRLKSWLKTVQTGT